jgi:hypothetical protein
VEFLPDVSRALPSESGATMSRRPRWNHKGAFEAKVAFAAIKGIERLAHFAQRFDVHANQIRSWRRSSTAGLRMLPVLAALHPHFAVEDRARPPLIKVGVSVQYDPERRPLPHWNINR